MKVILLRTVDKLGKPFDIIDVKKGYARNYLFPKKLAMPATDGNIRGLKKSEERFSKQMEKIKLMSMDIVERLNNLTIKTAIKTGIEGKSFGSITSNDLNELLKAEGIEIDKKNIMLEEPIKHPGVYDIRVHLAEKINGVFKLVVIEEGE
jgi:large subunit ribosomal protein L9